MGTINCENLVKHMGETESLFAPCAGYQFRVGQRLKIIITFFLIVAMFPCDHSQ